VTADEKYTVALDVMGSDRGHEAMIDGGLQAARRVGPPLRVVFVGRQEITERYLSTQRNLPRNISCEHAESEVPMGLAATEGVKMRDSSIAVGLRMVKEQKADAFVSPGNTGAVMASSLLTLGRIEGVSRPAIAAFFPTWTSHATVVLDVGANADCKPHHLSQFAIMGSVYAATLFNLESPRVGLISIGEERSKGNDLILGTQELLRSSKINFVGNVEGRDILSGTVDVAVTDGFTGNIILKFAESIKPMLVKSVQRQIQTNIFSRVGVWLLLPFLKRMRNAFDYAESGGAPLLGVNGVVIICHGSSNARAMGNAVVVAYEMASGKIRERIQEELVTNHFGQGNGAKDKSQDNRDRVVHPTPTND
jgi:glycerol-3-phosphate acyltransferase PlsX